jgi:putative endonuclease
MPLAAEWSSRAEGIPSEKGCLQQTRRSCAKGLPSAKTVVPQGKKMFFTYILKSTVDGSHYYGHCENLETRLKTHNGGKVRSTKAKRPWILHYSEEFKTRSEAYRRELFFKSIEGYKYLKAEGII